MTKVSKKSSAYEVDLVTLRGLEPGSYGLGGHFKCLEPNIVNVMVEVSISPADAIFGSQAKDSSVIKVVFGLGASYSPTERFHFGFSKSKRGVSAAAEISANPLHEGEQDMQNKLIGKHSSATPTKLNFLLKTTSGRVIGAAQYDMSTLEQGNTKRDIEVQFLSPSDGTSHQGYLTFHLTCFPLAECIEEEVHTVVEYQRLGWDGWGRSFAFYHPNGGNCAFSNVNATVFGEAIDDVAEPLKDGYEVVRNWEVDAFGGDREGFCYSRTFYSSRWWKGVSEGSSYVRRRGWRRVVRPKKNEVED